MPSNIDSRVSPSLHPENVNQIDGYDEVTAPYLAPTATAFSTAYIGVSAVWDAREAADKNPGWNESQRIVQVSKCAEKKFAQIAKSFDSTREILTKQIAYIEAELTAPVESKASTFIAAEIRAHAKSLPTDKLNGFIRQAMLDNDVVTMSALLGAPAFLSGMNGQVQKVYLRNYREHSSPELAQRLKAMQGAKTLLEERGALIFKELEKAVGAPPHKAAALHKAQEAATRALAM